MCIIKSRNNFTTDYLLGLLLVIEIFYTFLFRFDANSFDTENMNPEQLYNSFKKTSADIQNLSRLDFQFSNSRRDSSSHEEDVGFDSRRIFSPGSQEEVLLSFLSSLNF